MKSISIGSIIAATVLYAGAVWAANPPLNYKDVAKSDTELSQKINQQLLADPNLSAKDWEGLTVAVKNGKVILRGEVTSDAALKEVKRLVRRDNINVEDYSVTSEETLERTRDAWGG
jgi:hypothetical protein